MNEREFIQWLRGFLDAHTSSKDYELTEIQVETIKKQLSKVKIDNSNKSLYIEPDENTTTTTLLG